MKWTDLLQFLGVARKEIMPKLVTDGEAMKSRTPDRGRVKDADIRAIKNDAATNSGLSGFVLFDKYILVSSYREGIDREGIEAALSGLSLAKLARPLRPKPPH